MAEAKETSTDCNLITKTIERSAICPGPMGYLGELYNVRTEKFSSIKFFCNPLPEGTIETREFNSGKYDYSEDDTFTDRYRLLKVEGELKLSVMFGLSKLTGHGEYLSKEKKSERTVSCSLLYNYRTLHEKLLINFEKIKDCIDKNVLGDDNYTHVITEIIWGANNTVTLEYSDSNIENKTKVQGFLKGKLLSLEYSVSAHGSGKYDFEERKNTYKFRIKVLSDVLPGGKTFPTMEDAKNHILDIPKLVGKMPDGKGVVLSYVMIPLSNFRKLIKSQNAITATLKSIDESFTTRLAHFFEDVEEKKSQLTDLINDFKIYEKYLPSNCLCKIRDRLEKIKSNEHVVKEDLAKGLYNFRVGKIEMNDLIKTLEHHQSENLNITSITEFMDQFTGAESKIKYIRTCLSKNITYLGREESLYLLMINHPNADLFVMYTSEKLKKNNPNLSLKNYIYFLSKGESEKQNENTLFVVVDFDVNPNETTTSFLSKEVDEMKILHFKSGDCISSDVFKDYEATLNMNLAQVVQHSSMKYLSDKPEKRIVLKLPCPGGFGFGTCPKDPLIWDCSTCKKNLEYGFEDYFYCSCGKARIQSYKLKCGSLNHGHKYLSVMDNFPLAEELSKLTPPKDINILLLGESGVGKSTWINSIANYLRYETFEEAEKEGVISVTSPNFSDDDYNNKNFRFSKQVRAISESREPKTYDFFYGNTVVRLIDTPGLNDSEKDFNYDKEYMRKIVDHISHLEEIHGICVLMNANICKMTLTTKFCIMEILAHLNKSAASNILFCFTKSHNALYTAGQTTLQLLGSLLRELNLNNMISLNNDTMFCLDNAAFRFFTLFKHDDPYNSEYRQIFSCDWKHSASETKRLFERVRELKPHNIAKTRFLCEVKNQIHKLTNVCQLLALTSDEEKEITNEYVMQNSPRTSKTEDRKRLLEDQNKNYIAEREIIMQTLGQFGLFLKDNAILPSNYYLISHLDFLYHHLDYKTEKTKSDENLLQTLKNSKLDYKNEENIIAESMKNKSERNHLKAKDIAHLEKKLFNLELMGKQIKRKSEIFLSELVYND